MAIEETRFSYRGADGVGLAGFRWSGHGAPRAVLQLAHGAGEHCGRYRERLAPIVEDGFTIYAADHRGHGRTSGMSHLGDFGPGGADACLSDMTLLAQRARAENPGLPLIMMGHSMGAIFTQAWLPEHSDLVDAVVLSGTTGSGPRFEGEWNSAFPRARTDYDWLSRDTAEVDRYVADPFCGIRFVEASNASFLALVARALHASDPSTIRPGLPVYVLVGEDDPINNRLAGVRPLIEGYRAAGLDVTFKSYPGGRHEMLNEINRDEVISDLLAWLRKTFPVWRTGRS